MTEDDQDAPPADTAAPQSDKPVLEYRSAPDPAVDWVHLWTANNSFEAELAVMRLHDRGLHARADMLNTAGMLGAWGGTGPGGVNVQVLRPDAAAARAIIAEIETEAARRRHARSLACPKCGTPSARRAVPSLRWVALAALVAAPVLAVVLAQLGLEGGGWVFLLIPLGLVLLIWPLTPRWRCAVCGHRWSQREPDQLEDEDEDDAPA